MTAERKQALLDSLDRTQNALRDPNHNLQAALLQQGDILREVIEEL